MLCLARQLVKTPGDTTPELFLMTGLLDMKEYEHAQKVLNGFRKDLPQKPELASWSRILSRWSRRGCRSSEGGNLKSSAAPELSRAANR